MKWVRLTTDEQVSEELQYMGFLLTVEQIKDYCARRIMYSLRDDENVPHVTVLANPKEKRFVTVAGPENGGYDDSVVVYIKQLAHDLGGYSVDWSAKKRPTEKRKHFPGFNSISAELTDKGSSVQSTWHEHPYQQKIKFSDLKDETDSLLDAYNKASSDRERDSIKNKLKQLRAQVESIVDALLY